MLMGVLGKPRTRSTRVFESESPFLELHVLLLWLCDYLHRRVSKQGVSKHYSQNGILG